MKQSTHFITQTQLKLLLAIDEARQLFDGNTTSRILNLNPPAHDEDPSHRIGKWTEDKLYPSIYQFPTFDVNVSDPPTTWMHSESAYRLFQYGSSFWRVYVDDAMKRQSVSTIVNELIPYALGKLLWVTKIPVATSLTHPQAIALLGSTIQPQLYGASQMNSELVSSHAAQCLHINSKRQILISDYPSQFTYSSAANQYLDSDEDVLIRCIRVLAFTQRQGQMSSGDVGELVSCIIELRAMQVTMRKIRSEQNEDADPHEVVMPFGFQPQFLASQ
ncbi:hypothetical protein PCASD_03120 [Puccinia coronata f. sp. avenae]|nr:hypothetical protein PCASD_03120 [Puccinia coronata f. sp. avenae]